MQVIHSFVAWSCFVSLCGPFCWDGYVVGVVMVHGLSGCRVVGVVPLYDWVVDRVVCGLVACLVG